MAKVLKPGGTLIISEWDKKMSTIWGFSEDELPSPEQIATLLKPANYTGDAMQTVDRIVRELE